MTEMEFDKFVKPLENSLASKFSLIFFIINLNFTMCDICDLVWKKSQKEKKDTAAKKRAEAATTKTAEENKADTGEEGAESKVS
jgi:hypothetical protein